MATTARGPSLTMAQQALGLRSVFPGADLTLKPGRLSWTGRLQPCDLSRIYTVQITYALGRYPAVRVLAPKLQAAENGFLPHTYDNGTLCLYDAGQWNATMLIVDTIVPWQPNGCCTTRYGWPPANGPATTTTTPAPRARTTTTTCQQYDPPRVVPSQCLVPRGT